MTTQTEVPIREYTATVVGVAKQLKSDGWTLNLEVRPNMKHPDAFYGKDWKLVNNLKAGQRYTFLFRRDRLKDKKPEGSPHWWDYYEQLIEVRPAMGIAPPVGTGPASAPVGHAPTSQPAQVAHPPPASPAPAQAPVPAQDAPPWPDAEGGSERPKERSEWKQPKGEFRTPEQIIRTYALESATAFAVALIAKGIDVTHSTEVMLVASKYAAFITDGTLPKQPEAKGEQHGA